MLFIGWPFAKRTRPLLHICLVVVQSWATAELRMSWVASSLLEPFQTLRRLFATSLQLLLLLPAGIMVLISQWYEKQPPSAFRSFTKSVPRT